MTESATLVRSPSLTRYLERVAASLDLQGSINVQLRVTERGPVAFEINPRFSSSVVLRHLLGFEDLVWSLEERQGSAPSPYLPAEPGTRVYRGGSSIVVGAGQQAPGPPERSTLTGPRPGRPVRPYKAGSVATTPVHERQSGD